MSRIGVVTVTYNSSSVLEEFLDSIRKQTHTNFILYCVDSGSTDDTLVRIEKISDPRARIIPAGKNIGFAAGSNLGMKMALAEGCDHIMLLNNDTAFGPDLFQKLLDGIETYQCDMVTPKMLYYDPPNKIWAAGGHLNKWLAYRSHHDGDNHLDDGRFDQPRRVTFTPFCCILMKKSVFEKIGYLDDTYFVYMEDVDYCFQAIKSDLSLWYVPKAKLWHKVSSLTGNRSDVMVRYCVRNRIYFLRKHMPYWWAFSAYIYSQTRSALAFFLGRNSWVGWRLSRTAKTEGWNMPIQKKRR